MTYIGRKQKARSIRKQLPRLVYILIAALGIPSSILVSLVAAPWLLLFFGIALSPGPPAPVNTYGEFPFRLVYEAGGEQITVDDVLVCEYIGRGADEASGKYLRWDIRLLSGGDRSGFYMLHTYEWKDNATATLLDGVDFQNHTGSIFCDLGNPQYYLGYNIAEGYAPGGIYNTNGKRIGADTLWDEYGIQIIEASFSPPMDGNGIAIELWQ